MAGGLSDFHVMKCTNSEQYPEDEDRISLLSTDILVHILSFLKLKEAARTSLVSKLWVGLWMFAVVQLDFDASKVLLEIAAVRSEPSFLSKKRCHYVEWVNKVLQSHKAMVIDEFRICFELDESSQDDVDEWLLYAFAKRVKSLQLDFLQFGMPTAFVLEPYLFPSCRIFDQNVEENSIESLSIIHTKSFRTLRVTDFQSLRSLRLAGVDVTGETLHFLMEKFHLLEHLVVIGSQSEDLSSVLVCGSSSLKYLELTHCRCLKSIIVRDARHLVSLKYTWVSNVVLENVPELVDVWVSGWKFSRMILQLSSLLTRLESLTLRVSNSDVNEDVTRFLKVPHPIGLKQLTLDVRASEDDSLLRLTSSFMKSCPNLEKFVLKVPMSSLAYIYIYIYIYI
ncbi:OLC1v1018016C3 [Oldenlandia corymbosa var. corymbosa]|uniref:OLC1v1018016C3 n=2 Tax=Oldenlandia corymbosa var. corymbosa TaxID=529605 RepID=A0AAV1EAM9_OLDCO|nr:OLC1v1018016C3 [Oldenlandia corymbosa var. corymbosa]